MPFVVPRLFGLAGPAAACPAPREPASPVDVFDDWETKRVAVDKVDDWEYQFGPWMDVSNDWEIKMDVSNDWETENVAQSFKTSTRPTK